MLEEILVTSRLLVELGDVEASKLSEELRLRRRELLDRLESEEGREKR
jgi:hypothetical protein